MTNRGLRALLERLRACQAARDWVGDRDGLAAWTECERGDYLLWLCAKVGVDRRLLVRAAVACAQPAVTAYVPADEPRPQAALDAALTWADAPTEPNLEHVRATADAAAVAGADAADAAAAYAAYAAYAAARARSLRASAGIVRETIPFEIIVAALDGLEVPA